MARIIVLAATPVFAAMALLSYLAWVHLPPAMPRALTLMYLLMAVAHLPPWLTGTPACAVAPDKISEENCHEA